MKLISQTLNTPDQLTEFVNQYGIAPQNVQKIENNTIFYWQHEPVDFREFNRVVVEV